MNSILKAFLTIAVIYFIGSLIMFLLFMIIIIMAARANSHSTISSNSPYKHKHKQPNGIVFFDIDDTLSNMPMKDRDNIIRYCIDKGYDVGIITASNRPKWYVINHDGTPNTELSPWMSPILARQIFDTNFKTYNTMSLTAGTNVPFPAFPIHPKMYGWKKGWQMNKAIEENGYDRSKSFLFDDQPIVLQAASEICKDCNFILVDNNSPKSQLKLENIKLLIS